MKHRWLCTLLCALSLNAAAASRIHLQTLPLAGFHHHQGKQVWAQLQLGDPLQLVRETHNPHDPLAVRVDWSNAQQTVTLGYLPRELSGPVAQALDQGKTLSARINALRDHPNPRLRVSLDVFLVRDK